MRAPRRSIVAAVCAALALGAAACGSSDDGGSGSAGSGTSDGGAASFSYGYSLPTGQNPWMNAIADVVQETAGGQMERTDAQLDPAKAVQQINRFVTDGVAAIAVAPAQVPEALHASLSRAAGDDIKLFALEWSFDADPAAPPKPPVQGQASVDRGRLGRDVAAKVEQDAGGAAKVIYIGLPFPVASLDFFEQSFRAALSGGSQVVADVDNPRDNAQGALGPLRGALSNQPDANAIVTYNGASALAAIEAVRSAGLADRVKIYCIQLDGSIRAAIADGRITASWDLNPPQLGEALGGLIAAAGAGEPESAWARTVAIEAPVYTPQTIGDWTDWSAGR
jgi:ABC-type sugar transport system substrate-binding protein